MQSKALVAVVDDDASVRESLPDLLSVLGYGSAAFASAEEFLASPTLAIANCLLLDIAMPGMTGPELAQELARQVNQVPIVFITAYRDTPLLDRQLGDMPVLLKPFDDEELQAAIHAVLAA